MEKLKERLIQVRENKFDIDNLNINLKDTTTAMLDNIGNTDFELRDDLIYTTFAHWIYKKRYYTDQELREILHICLDDEHLFYKIGTKGDDSVYTRSFTILLLTLLIARQREDEFLLEEDLKTLKEKVISYLDKEKDYRGYDQDNGWIHAIAHSGDALNQLTMCSFVEKDDLIKILDIIRSKFMIDSDVYINEEDERIVSALMTIFQRDELTEDEIIHWIKGFEEVERGNEFHKYQYLLVNIKSLLRSLYFRLVEEGNFEAVIQQIIDTLGEISNFRRKDK